MIAGRLATMQPERLTSVIYIAEPAASRRHRPSWMTLRQESVKDLESDLPFKSLVVALQPRGRKAANRR